MNKRNKFMVPPSAFIVSCRPSSRPPGGHPFRGPARRKADLGRNITSLAYRGPFVKLILVRSVGHERARREAARESNKLTFPSLAEVDSFDYRS